jgi:predicted ArsR family transcriptional regulator
MSSKPERREREMAIDDVASFVREHEDPVVTATEVAEQFDVTRKAARYRLQQLESDGDIGRKKIGAAAVAWYPRG